MWQSCEERSFRIKRSIVPSFTKKKRREKNNSGHVGVSKKMAGWSKESKKNPNEKKYEIKGVEVKYSLSFCWILLGFYKWVFVTVSSGASYTWFMRELF